MYPILKKDIEVSEALLSDTDLQGYKEKGWIVPKWEFPTELMFQMREEYNALLERNSNLSSDIMMAPHQTRGGSMGVVG